MKDYAMIADKSILERSSMSGMSKLFGKSTVMDDSFLAGNSTVSGESDVLNSVIDGTALVTDKSMVVKSHIDGTAIVSGEALILDSYIGGNVRVTGCAMANGISLSDNEYLTEGIWDRKPLYLESFSIWKPEYNTYFYENLTMAITESIEDRWTVGCTTKSHGFWMRFFSYKYTRAVKYKNEPDREMALRYMEALGYLTGKRIKMRT